MLRLEQRVFAQTHHVGVHQVVAPAQRFAQFGVGTQGKVAAVNIDCRVIFYRAAVGGGDVVIGVAIGLQDLDGRRQHGGALAVAQRAQRGASGVAGKGKAFGQIQPGGVHPHQRRAQHGVRQGSARTGAMRPLAAKVVGK